MYASFYVLFDLFYLFFFRSCFFLLCEVGNTSLWQCCVFWVDLLHLFFFKLKASSWITRTQEKKLKQYEIHYSRRSYNSTTLVQKKKKEKEIVPIRVRKVCRRSRGIAPPILNLDAGWSWVVNITPRPLNPFPPTWKERLSSGLDETFGEEKNLRTVTLPKLLHFSL
jgi:hypothetical protein